MNGKLALAALFVVAGSLSVATSGLAQQAAQDWVTPSVVPHEIEGRTACMMCHTAGAMEAVPDVPQDHEGRANETCLMCHAEDAAVQTVAPPTIPHDVQGRSACLMCHTAGAMEAVPDAPADHEGRTNQMCSWCHLPTESG